MVAVNNGIWRAAIKAGGIPHLMAETGITPPTSERRAQRLKPEMWISKSIAQAIQTRPPDMTPIDMINALASGLGGKRRAKRSA